MTPQPKTIAEIAKEASAPAKPAKPPNPPSTGSRINGKWVAQLEKFIGLDVQVQPRLDSDHVYNGRLLALDLQHFHVILELANRIVLIRQPSTITRWTSARPPAERSEAHSQATALSPTSDLTGDSKPITENPSGGGS